MGVDAKPELLSEQINKATRSLHTQLNRLITSRLPLCLPPFTTSPEIYAIGFAHFAQIYLSFEAVWEHVLVTHASCTVPHITACEPSCKHPIDTRSFSRSNTQKPDGGDDWKSIIALLASIRPPGLSRSERIINDLSTLLQIPAEKVTSHLETWSRSSSASVTFMDRVSGAALSKPHILLAYAWVMYMAVFSGGRYIRAQLLRAGQEFWLPMGTRSTRNHDEPVGMEVLPLTFWHHPGDHDGEDIKTEFKRRLVEAETLLSVEQRQDIVDEAGRIFDLCLALVQELETAAATACTVPDTHGLTVGVKMVDEQPSTSTYIPSSPILKKRPQVEWSKSFWTTTAITIGAGLFTWLTRGQGLLEAFQT